MYKPYAKKGATIAQYTGQVLHKKVRESKHFDRKEYREALKDGYMTIDKEISEGNSSMMRKAVYSNRLKSFQTQALHTILRVAPLSRHSLRPITKS